MIEPVSGGAHDGEFLARYLEQFQAMTRDSAAWIPDMVRVKVLVTAASRAGKKVVLLGNGGSAAIASHVAVDLTKNAGIRAINFNEADLITCLANDYGYERWMEQAVEFYGEPGDVLIAISSSGRSPNVLRACEAARRQKFSAVVTLSGFAPENPLRRLGDVNFWADSAAYNLVETLHQLWLLALVDLIIGRAEYSASEPRAKARA